MTLDIKRILVPVDFSANSDRALDYAHVLAQKFDAGLHLVHVCEVPGMMTPALDAYAIAYADWSQRLSEEAGRELAKKAGGLLDVAVTTEVLVGTPAAAIVDTATAGDTDLIVMGTHGHGAMMHLLMGNVAERVVRTAPCPVLTVREPRVREARPVKKTSFAGLMAASIVVAGLTVATVGVTSASAQTPAAPAETYQQTTPGAEVFRTYCATCHGTSARGDGPLASSMKQKPANLTEIAKRNGGLFPTDLVFRTIDGRQPVRGHGGPDMPVWGDAFSKSREAGDKDRVKAVIDSLVSFLESIQLRPAHEQ